MKPSPVRRWVAGRERLRAPLIDKVPDQKPIGLPRRCGLRQVRPRIAVHIPLGGRGIHRRSRDRLGRTSARSAHGRLPFREARMGGRPLRRGGAFHVPLFERPSGVVQSGPSPDSGPSAWIGQHSDPRLPALGKRLCPGRRASASVARATEQPPDEVAVARATRATSPRARRPAV
jgi:hypothetical protein